MVKSSWTKNHHPYKKMLGTAELEGVELRWLEFWVNWPYTPDDCFALRVPGHKISGIWVDDYVLSAPVYAELLAQAIEHYLKSVQ